MRTVRINIQESYIPSLNAFLETLPKEAVETQKSLDDEIRSCLNEYKNGTMKTTFCNNGDCYRTYDNGKQKHFQVSPTYDPINSQWKYDAGSC